MKKIIPLLFFLLPLTGAAQYFRIEFGYSLLVNSQSGTLYAQSRDFNHPWYDAYKIDRRFWHSGFCLQVYYPLNFGTHSFERISCGPQIGITVNESSVNASLDKNYQALGRDPSIRIPMLFVIRTGCTNALYDKKRGIAVGGGVEWMDVNFADETGQFLAPVVQLGLGIKRVIISANFYPQSLTSVYLLNGNETDRLTNKLVEFRFLISIECMRKKLRLEKDRRSYPKKQARR